MESEAWSWSRALRLGDFAAIADWFIRYFFVAAFTGILTAALAKSPEACSKHCGKPWFSRPRLADRCAILSFRSLYALATTISLRCRRRSSVNAAFD